MDPQTFWIPASGWCRTENDMSYEEIKPVQLVCFGLYAVGPELSCISRSILSSRLITAIMLHGKLWVQPAPDLLPTVCRGMLHRLSPTGLEQAIFRPVLVTSTGAILQIILPLFNTMNVYASPVRALFIKQAV